MIAIKRSKVKCPDILKGSPINGDHFNDGKVVKALRRMQHNKCCYCEKELPRFGQGKHVEHFQPKEIQKYAKYRNHWPNLFLACPDCNGYKDDNFPCDKNGPKLINPSTADPENHIEFVADAEADRYEPIGMPMQKTPKGRTTIEVIGLWIPDRVRERRKYFENIIRPIYSRMKKAKQQKDAMKMKKAVSDFKVLMSAKAEFAGLARSLARNMELDKEYKLNIPVGA